mmetsp:Transcript_59469/g.150708  ORF Transcript_59469/g.150708 Transcript_59469/m.150708 type:complete len:232 (+) Transcript_59469:2846-3541(+)
MSDSLLSRRIPGMAATTTRFASILSRRCLVRARCRGRGCHHRRGRFRGARATGPSRSSPRCRPSAAPLPSPARAPTRGRKPLPSETAPSTSDTPHRPPVAKAVPSAKGCRMRAFHRHQRPPQRRQRCPAGCGQVACSQVRMRTRKKTTLQTASGALGQPARVHWPRRRCSSLMSRSPSRTKTSFSTMQTQTRKRRRRTKKTTKTGRSLSSGTAPPAVVPQPLGMRSPPKAS